MTWIDAGLVAAVAAGALFGAQRGVLRQLMLVGAFYVSLVAAARWYGDVAGYLIVLVPRADRSLAAAYALAGITAGGTLALLWLSHQVYGATRLPRLAFVDQLAGAGLGLAWSWAVVAFAVTVLAYGLTFSWGPNDGVRHEIGAAASRSRVVAAVRDSLPQLRDLLLPWLPGGLPAPLSI